MPIDATHPPIPREPQPPPVSPILSDIIHSPHLPALVAELDAFLKSEAERRQAFYEWLSDDIKAEFIDGQVVVHSPVAMKHNVITKNLSQLLSAFVIKHDLGFVGVEKILVKLSRNDFEPDVCYFSKEKAKHFSDKTMFFPVPDLVVEVLSKSTMKNDRGVKFQDYAANGVAEYWIIDPEDETVEKHVNKGGTFELAQKLRSGTIASRVVPNFTIDLKAIFNEADMLAALKSFL